MSDGFESPFPEHRRRREPVQLSLFLNIDGFEGPIDVLLQLARDQKVDLIHVSVLQLAEQYLGFVNQAQKLNLELAADYLVMAAWLAYLKSRLLLPPDVKEEEEQSPEEMAEALRFQLMRLEAMQQAGGALMALPQFGADFFARGQGESLSIRKRPIYDVTLYELLRAYADHRVRHDRLALRIEATHLYSVEDAVRRLSRVLGAVPDWQTLFSFLPSGLRKGLRLRSAVASTFVASLQLVKDGKAEINQAGAFAPIYFRSREGDA